MKETMNNRDKDAMRKPDHEELFAIEFIQKQIPSLVGEFFISSMKKETLIALLNGYSALTAAHLSTPDEELYRKVENPEYKEWKKVVMLGGGDNMKRPARYIFEPINTKTKKGE